MLRTCDTGVINKTFDVKLSSTNSNRSARYQTSFFRLISRLYNPCGLNPITLVEKYCPFSNNQSVRLLRRKSGADFFGQSAANFIRMHASTLNFTVNAGERQGNFPIDNDPNKRLGSLSAERWINSPAGTSRHLWTPRRFLSKQTIVTACIDASSLKLKVFD